MYRRFLIHMITHTVRTFPDYSGMHSAAPCMFPSKGTGRKRKDRSGNNISMQITIYRSLRSKAAAMRCCAGSA